MVKVFFGYSMRGGYQILNKEKLRVLFNHIQDMGFEIVTKKFFDLEGDKSNLSDQDIFESDFKGMQEADVGIFEISNPSLGVGSEITDMIHMKKPVLCLYREDLYNIVSANILGKESSDYIQSPFKALAYDSEEDIEKKIKEFVETHGNSA